MKKIPAENTNFFKTSEFVFRQDRTFSLRAFLQDPQVDTASHQHEFAECAIVVRGTGEHQCGSNPHCPIAAGDVIIIPTGGFHSYLNTKDLAVINLLFDTGKLPPVLMELYTNPVYKRLFLRSAESYGGQDFPLLHLSGSVYEEIRFYADRFAAACEQPGNHCSKLGLFMVLINQLCNADVRESEAAETVPLNIPKLVSFLDENYHRKVYTEELCRLSGMSGSTLIRHFQAALGDPPAGYLRKVRLRHAAEMLLNTGFSLKEIAERCGFQSGTYFFRSFKQEYGIPPLQFRYGSRKT